MLQSKAVPPARLHWLVHFLGGAKWTFGVLVLCGLQMESEYQLYTLTPFLALRGPPWSHGFLWSRSAVRGLCDVCCIMRRVLIRLLALADLLAGVALTRIVCLSFLQLSDFLHLRLLHGLHELQMETPRLLLDLEASSCTNRQEEGSYPAIIRFLAVCLSDLAWLLPQLKLGTSEA